MIMKAFSVTCVNFSVGATETPQLFKIVIYIFILFCNTAEKWQAVYTILEAFGNSSTSMNTNASHFSHVVSLDFDQAGQVASASIQVKHTLTLLPSVTSLHTYNTYCLSIASIDSNNPKSLQDEGLQTETVQTLTSSHTTTHLTEYIHSSTLWLLLSPPV